MSRSAESKFDPVVANLTPSQKRQITQLYGGGDPPSGGKWEPMPSLTPDQIKLVMAEQNMKYPTSHATHDYETIQTGMYPYPPTQQPFMGPSSAFASAGHAVINNDNTKSLHQRCTRTVKPVASTQLIIAVAYSP